MTDTPHVDALLMALISGEESVEGFATLTDEHEREKALHVLLALLTDPVPRLRERAAQALAALNDRQAVEPLIHSLDESNDRVRVQSNDRVELNVLVAKVDALTALGDPAAVQPLLVHVGLNMKKVIERLDRDEAFRVLSDATEHAYWPTRTNVFQRLMHLKDPRSVPIFLNALTDDNSSIRQFAIEALTDLQHALSAPLLLPHVSSPHEEVRRSIAILLGGLGDPQAIPALVPLLSDKDKTIRTQAALALGKLGDSSGLTMIQEHIRQGVHARGAVYFGDIADALHVLQAAGVPLLIELIDVLLERRVYKREDVLILIAETLARWGDSSALPVLSHMETHDDAAVRATAQQAIEAIKARMEGHQ